MKLCSSIFSIVAMLVSLPATAAYYSSIEGINNTYGTLVGSRANNAKVTQAPISSLSTYDELVSQLPTKNEWYVTSGYNANISGYAATPGAITIVAGGPANNGSAMSTAIMFDITKEQLASMTDEFILFFDVRLTDAGNNKENHAFNFNLSTLLNPGSTNPWYSKKSISLHTKTNNTPSGLTTMQISMATILDDMKARESDHTMILQIQTSETYGSNKGIEVSNFRVLVPEPATATLSLLGLGALAWRRRRH